MPLSWKSSIILRLCAGGDVRPVVPLPFVVRGRVVSEADDVIVFMPSGLQASKGRRYKS